MTRAAAPDVAVAVDGDGGVDDDGVGEGGREGAEVDGAVPRRGLSAGGGTGARQEVGHSDGGVDMVEGSEKKNSAGNDGSRGGPGRCGAGRRGGTSGR